MILARHDLALMDPLGRCTMDMQEGYAARLEAQMRAADARIDQLEAQARARHAQAEMDEISGLRARRDQIRKQVANARQELRGDWEAVRSRVDHDWAGFRRDVENVHSRYTAWDAAREQRFNAHLDEARAALRESAARDAESAADVRIEITRAQQELRDKAEKARRSYDAWNQRRTDEQRQQALNDAELELDEAKFRYSAALEAAGRR